MCNGIPATPVPDAVSALIGNARLLFTATYNVEDFGTDPINENCVSVNIGILPTNQYTALYVENLPFQTNSLGSRRFIYENYNFTTWTSDFIKQYGFINMSNAYPNDTTITNLDVVRFAVNGKNGIYKCVTDVVIDYTNPIRVVYFFQKKSKNTK
jgi:hypothetical protein